MADASAQKEIPRRERWRAPPRPPLHLRLAITGHRRSPRADAIVPRPAKFDFAKVEAGLQSVFAAAAAALTSLPPGDRAMFDPGPPALTLLSALAQGADQMAVDAFRAVGLSGVAPRLEVVLPFEEAEYARGIRDADLIHPDDAPDPANVAAAARMYELARKADRVFVLAETRDVSELRPEAERGAQTRWWDQSYAFAGDILVRQADILVAVWNGAPSADLGGTAFVVGMALREGLPVVWIDAYTGAIRMFAPPHGEGDRLAALKWRTGLGESADAGASPSLTGANLAAQMRQTVHALVLPPKIDPAAEHDETGMLSATIARAAGWLGFGEVPAPGTAGRFLGLMPARPGGRHRYFEPARAHTWWTAYEWMLWISGAQAPLDKGHEQEIPHEHDVKPARPWAKIPSLRQPRQADYVRSAYHDWAKLEAQRRDAPQSVAKSAYDGAGVGQALHPDAPWPSWSAAAALREIWGHADAAATRLSHEYRSAYVMAFGLAAMAVLIGLSAQYGKAEGKFWFVSIEFALLISAASAYLIANTPGVHARYIRVRELAEQFRPAWVLAQLGLGGRRVMGPRATWTAWAAQAWAGALGVPDFRATQQNLADLAKTVADTVVADQIGYHRRNHVRLRILHKFLDFWARCFFWLAIGAAASYLAVVLWLHPSKTGEFYHALSASVTLACAGFPALAAALAGIRFQGDFERFSKRSRISHGELVKIGAALEDLRARAVAGAPNGGIFNELRDLLLRLDAVLTADLQDWEFVYQSRPNDPP